MKSIVSAVGGNHLDYPGITATSCASLTTTKCLLNSTLSTPDAKFMVLDIKSFYYGMPMECYKYMKLPLVRNRSRKQCFQSIGNVNYKMLSCSMQVCNDRTNDRGLRQCPWYSIRRLIRRLMPTVKNRQVEPGYSPILPLLLGLLRGPKE